MCSGFKMIRVFFTCLILNACSSAAAYPESSSEVDALVHQAESKGLARHSYWMALMHYRHNAQGIDTGVASEIISPEFFLSSSGPTNPASELAATLAAFFKDPGSDPDSHAQCRFIARYKWLRKSLDWKGLKPPSVVCKQFNEWTMNGQVESLSLVFATGYLSNPASFYGHILMKFNTNRAVVSIDILDESVNFGAIVPSNENGVLYVLKGLFGGYDASFSNTRFYRLNHMYAENELRDMWEYELALSKDEVDQISAHSWELLKVRFTYYFLRENCAYRMAELLELVIGQPLLPSDLPWSLPATVFNRIASLDRNGIPLVRKVRLIPSRLNSFYAKYSSLTPAQELLARELVAGTANFAKPAYSVLPEAEKVAIVDSLLDYYEFRIVANEKSADLKKEKQKLLLERAGLASQRQSGIGKQPPIFSASPPHEGPLPGMIRLGLLHNSHWGGGVELRFRPAYYDFLQLDAGHIADSNLTMFDFRMIYANDRLRLRGLDLVNIETLNVSRTRLPDEGGLAWKVKFGFESQHLGCEDCLNFNFTGGLGKAAPVTGKVTSYGMIDLFAQTKYLNYGTIGAIPRVGLIGSPVEDWKSNFTIGRRIYTNGSLSGNRLIRWENRFGSRRDWDARVSYEYNIAHEFQMAVSTYW